MASWPSFRSAPPSRTAIEDYDRLNRDLVQQVDTLNCKWGRAAWKPVIFVRRHVDQTALAALHLMADFCLVSSLHDGMNLVAKEFVASRIDGDGVLILSEFGAARELTDALIVNPFAVDEIADAMHRALNMPATERRQRMNRMRATVCANNVYRWVGKILLKLSSIEVGSVPDAPPVEDKSGACPWDGNVAFTFAGLEINGDPVERLEKDQSIARVAAS